MTQMKRNFLQTFNKQNFDHMDPEINLDMFHPQMRLVLALNGLWFSNKDSKLRFVWPLLCTAVSIVAAAMELIAVAHGLKVEDAALFTEAFAYSVVIGSVPFLYFSLLQNSNKIFALVETMDNDFRYICNELGDPYNQHNLDYVCNVLATGTVSTLTWSVYIVLSSLRTKFLEGQLLIWQYGMSWLVFVTFVAALYILISVFAVLYYCLFATYDEDTVKPMIFPLWLPEDDPHKSPLYEIFMCIMYMSIVVFVTTFTAYVYILFHLWLHAYFLIDLVLISLEHLFDDLDDRVLILDQEDQQFIECRQQLKKRVKRIVTWHNGAFRLIIDTRNVFDVILAYQIVFSSIVLCLMAFYITVQLQQGKIDICLSLLCVGAVLQLWIPCYIGSQLRTKGFQVADYCFYSGWHGTKLVRLVLTDLTVIIVRSQRPITIQGTCLPPLQLETFSSIISTTYSYFNMLQQKN